VEWAPPCKIRHSGRGYHCGHPHWQHDGLDDDEYDYPQQIWLDVHPENENKETIYNKPETKTWTRTEL